MGNRVLKESVKTSPQIDSLSWFEEVVFYRLIVSADDYGCADGRTVLLRNQLFPTKDSVTKKAIDDAISTLASVGLLRRYEVNGMPYLFFPTWEKHQRVRNKHRKCPPPPGDIDLTANRCQLSADCCQLSADCQPESNPIQSESESNPNPIQKASACASALDIALEDFAEFRKKIRKPLTEKAKELTLAELEKLAPGDDAAKVAILEQSIQRGWQGVFPLKGAQKAQHSTYGGDELPDFGGEE